MNLLMRTFTVDPKVNKESKQENVKSIHIIS